MSVYVYHAQGDNEEIKVFSSLEKAISYAKSTYYEDAEFEKDEYEDDGKHWSFDCEDPVDIWELDVL